MRRIRNFFNHLKQKNMGEIIRGKVIRMELTNPGGNSTKTNIVVSSKERGDLMGTLVPELEKEVLLGDVVEFQATVSIDRFKYPSNMRLLRGEELLKNAPKPGLNMNVLAPQDEISTILFSKFMPGSSEEDYLDVYSIAEGMGYNGDPKTSLWTTSVIQKIMRIHNIDTITRTDEFGKKRVGYCLRKV